MMREFKKYILVEFQKPSPRSNLSYPVFVEAFASPLSRDYENIRLHVLNMFSCECKNRNHFLPHANYNMAQSDQKWLKSDHL